MIKMKDLILDMGPVPVSWISSGILDQLQVPYNEEEYGRSMAGPNLYIAIVLTRPCGQVFPSHFYIFFYWMYLHRTHTHTHTPHTTPTHHPLPTHTPPPPSPRPVLQQQVPTRKYGI